MFPSQEKKFKAPFYTAVVLWAATMLIMGVDAYKDRQKIQTLTQELIEVKKSKPAECTVTPTNDPNTYELKLRHFGDDPSAELYYQLGGRATSTVRG